MRPVLAISLGCPSGVGPEVAVAAASAHAELVCLLVGAEPVIRRAAEITGVAQRRLTRVDDPFRPLALRDLRPRQIAFFSPETLSLTDAPFGRPSKAAGRAQLAWIDAATLLTSRGVAAGLVTGPVSKSAIASSGARGAARFRGHTEHLAALLGAREVVMAFWAPALTIGLATTHLSLKRVPRALTREAVASAAFHVTQLAARLGAPNPRVAVTGLNPHAGESGLLGTEEDSVITPGIVAARRRLEGARIRARLEGPLGAETAIRMASAGHYAAVVAMYHDQATIPMKLVAFGDAVNVTLGLPVVRTSVDHGTAYDLAGTGKADVRGMAAAITLAGRLSARPARRLSARRA